MKRSLFAAVLVAVLVSSLPAVTFNGADYQLNGDADIIGDDLYLTGLGGNQAGAAFDTTTFALSQTNAFSFSFQFLIQSNSAGVNVRGDGLAFVLQQSGAGAGGTGGSDMGYSGIPGTSVAFLIDTFNFGDELETPSISFAFDGDIGTRTNEVTLPFTGPAAGDAIRGAVFNVVVSYLVGTNVLEPLGGTLEGRIFGTGSDGTTIDSTTSVYFADASFLTGDYYAGYTAGSGLADDAHIIVGVRVPEPASAVAVLAASGLGLSRRRRR